MQALWHGDDVDGIGAPGCAEISLFLHDLTDNELKTLSHRTAFSA
jgi:hypothetical protein